MADCTVLHINFKKIVGDALDFAAPPGYTPFLLCLPTGVLSGNRWSRLTYLLYRVNITKVISVTLLVF